MIKIKILNPTKDRNTPTFNPLIRVRDMLRDYSIDLTDSDDFDYMFVGMSDFIDKKKPLQESIEWGLENISKITGDYFLFDGSDSTSLMGAYEVFEQSDAVYLLKNQKFHTREAVSTYYWIGTNQKMYFGYYDGQWRQVGGGGTSVCDNTWHQLVWARNGTEHKMYVDGSLDQTTTMNSSMAGTINVIGAKWGGGYPLNGHLAHFSMYNAQLSAHQISTMFAGQRRRFGV